jgi:hypothetical protein
LPLSRSRPILRRAPSVASTDNAASPKPSSFGAFECALTSGDRENKVAEITEGSERHAAKELLGSKPPMDVIAGVRSDSCPSICGASSRRAKVPSVAAESAVFENSAGRARYEISRPRPELRPSEDPTRRAAL